MLIKFLGNLEFRLEIFSLSVQSPRKIAIPKRAPKSKWSKADSIKEARQSFNLLTLVKAYNLD